MSPLPGADYEIIDAAPPPTSQTDTGTAFLAGFADRGPVTGQVAASDVITSPAQFFDRYGDAQSYNGDLVCAVQGHFAEGGSRMFFSRLVGADPVAASADVPASSSKFTATAVNPGGWGNNLTVTVATGVITIKENGVTVVTTPAFSDIDDAVAWFADGSHYVTLTALTTGALTNASNVALTGGDDDRDGVTSAEKAAALARFGKTLGPGQVAIPGDTSDDAWEAVSAHALAANRHGYWDAPNADSVTATLTAAGSIRDDGRDVARKVQPLHGWIVVPGLTPASTRTAPPSAIMTGLAARVDQQGNPNVAVAGRNALSRWALDTLYELTDDQREQLADAGVTPVIVKDGLVQPYDDVMPVDPDTDPEWLGAAGNRLVMRIVADALKVADAHMFGAVGGTVDLDHFHDDLVAMLTGWWQLPPGVPGRGLYGDTAADAFRVETGPNVNTPDTIQARQLRASLALKLAPNARFVHVTITNSPLTAAL